MVNEIDPRGFVAPAPFVTRAELAFERRVARVALKALAAAASLFFYFACGYAVCAVMHEGLNTPVPILGPFTIGN